MSKFRILTTIENKPVYMEWSKEQTIAWRLTLRKKFQICSIKVLICQWILFYLGDAGDVHRDASGDLLNKDIAQIFKNVFCMFVQTGFIIDCEFSKHQHFVLKMQTWIRQYTSVTLQLLACNYKMLVPHCWSESKYTNSNKNFRKKNWL